MTKRKKIEYLEGKVVSLTNTLDREIEHRGELEKELAKMTRLLKHHGKGPCCELSWTYSWMSHRNETPKLYMYICDEEYVIELSELKDRSLDRTTITFELDPVDKHFALFAIQNEGHMILHKFTIDYLNNKYLYSRSDVEDRKEETNA